jgi:hypothetical protein
MAISYIKKIVVLVCLTLTFVGSKSHAESMRDFLMNCAYGTMAGALVGVASLAFTDDPSTNMNNIAKGASLGLYAGIALGVYQYQNAGAVVYNQEIKQNTESGLQWALIPIGEQLTKESRSPVAGYSLSVSSQF